MIVMIVMIVPVFCWGESFDDSDIGGSTGWISGVLQKISWIIARILVLELVMSEIQSVIKTCMVEMMVSG